MKKIDQLLIRSFIPPFILTFLVALFVLIMQFLWLHIEDIIGKGVGFVVIIELFFYLSISLIPLALPIAVIISSVMVMGNLAERYELTSLKSAGIPLIRIMLPMIYFTGAVMLCSILFSNYLIPLANLQYKTRLADISRQKMALSLETGVFNDDFKDMAIHIGKKDSDGRHIEDVIIHDYSNKGSEPMRILADKGEMHVSADGKHLVMNLFDGVQYQETGQLGSKENKAYPFSRTSFQQWNKVFDLSEFDLKLNDTEKYNEHYAMLSVPQLQAGIDTLDKKINTKISKMGEHFNQYIIFKTDTFSKKPPIKKREILPKTPLNKKPISKVAKTKNEASPLVQKIEKPLAQYLNITETFEQEKVQEDLTSKAKSFALNINNKAHLTEHQIYKDLENRVKHIYELNFKFSLALSCCIFLFIGAPMGAIVRKGGFGYPILIAIIFFMVYIVLNVLFKKLAESFMIPPLLAAWSPCLILLPIGLFLTYKAMKDQELFRV